jgi:phosphoglycolate phosphatase-like HAD superfamily hydrolase
VSFANRPYGGHVTLKPPVVGFDLDMTLVDSREGIVATLLAALSDVTGDAPAVTAEQIEPWIGVPLEDTVIALAPGADADAVADRYRELYATLGAPRTTLLPGATDALAAVRALSGRVLIVSAKAEPGVHEVLAQVGLDHGDLAPDLVVGWLFAAAKGERLLAEGADIYVGDHVGDMAAAKLAGATAVGVATGPVPAEELAAAGADVVLPDLRAFPGWLDSYRTVRIGRAPTPDGPIA